MIWGVYFIPNQLLGYPIQSEIGRISKKILSKAMIHLPKVTEKGVIMQMLTLAERGDWGFKNGLKYADVILAWCLIPNC